MFKTRSLLECLAEGVPEMMPMPAAFDGFVEDAKRVSSTCLITHEHNRYSVPASFANRVISLRIYPERLVMVAEAQLVAEHTRAFNRDKSLPGRTVYDWRHLPDRGSTQVRSTAQWRPLRHAAGELPPVAKQTAQRLGSDPEMADILALVLLHDEQRVEQAVSKALELG